MADELKPCPFCGDDGIVRQCGGRDRKLVQCDICGISHFSWQDRPIEAALLARAEAAEASRDRLWEQVQYYERTRICHSPYAKRPILYTDTVNGEQCCVDNLWAISTEELNMMWRSEGALNHIMARCEGSDTGTICYPEICAIIKEETNEQ
jgi:hypothetical protein